MRLTDGAQIERVVVERRYAASCGDGIQCGIEHLLGRVGRDAERQVGSPLSVRRSQASQRQPIRGARSVGPAPADGYVPSAIGVDVGPHLFHQARSVFLRDLPPVEVGVVVSPQVLIKAAQIVAAVDIVHEIHSHQGLVEIARWLPRHPLQSISQPSKRASAFSHGFHGRRVGVKGGQGFLVRRP